jgi:hypothetical protein
MPASSSVPSVNHIPVSVKGIRAIGRYSLGRIKMLQAW